MKPLIEVYEFYSAPEELKNMSGNGGDEDWIIVLNGNDPRGIAEEMARKLAICDYSTHFDHANNRLVYICFHA